MEFAYHNKKKNVPLPFVFEKKVMGSPKNMTTKKPLLPLPYSHCFEKKFPQIEYSPGKCTAPTTTPFECL